MDKQEEYHPTQAYSTGYPPNPIGSPAYPPNLSGPPSYSSNPPCYFSNPPGYPTNPSGPPVYAPHPVPIYSNIQPSYYSSQPSPGVIVTTQPNVMVLPQPAYKDYLAWSVINLIFCNLILGIVAVIFSSKTRDAVRYGDSTLTASYSRTALSLNILALVLGIIAHICWISWVIYWSATYDSHFGYYSNG